MKNKDKNTEISKASSQADTPYNRELLQSMLQLGEQERTNNGLLIHALIVGENAPFIKNFHPKNHLKHIQQNTHE
ncbi:MAG: hypothetical protein ACI9GM_000864 [Salibacteraceae bacterium]|jgi:hypothetical protein